MYFPPAEHYDVVKSALDVIQATHYYRESDPHADANQEYCSEQLALTARALVEAVDKRPEEDQPIGWARESVPSAAEATVARVRKFADDMADWCSPHGVAADYAKRLMAVIDDTQEV